MRENASAGLETTGNDDSIDPLATDGGVVTADDSGGEAPDEDEEDDDCDCDELPGDIPCFECYKDGATFPEEGD